MWEHYVLLANTLTQLHRYVFNNKKDYFFFYFNCLLGKSFQDISEKYAQDDGKGLWWLKGRKTLI